mmetsp:Transcript_1608/g.2218  ORF Transcript_1608/g.2218 Transcript_1608/m.2218 type:complete len:96 (+) Transcript_1608:137-424(+)
MPRQAATGNTSVGKPAPNRGPTGTSAANRRKASRPSASAAAARPRGAPGGSQAGILRFYTDDAPGLKIGPTVVLVFSLSFIGCVVLLHIWGKFRS